MKVVLSLPILSLATFLPHFVLERFRLRIVGADGFEQGYDVEYEFFG